MKALPSVTLALLVVTVSGCSQQAAPATKGKRDRPQFEYEAVSTNHDVAVPEGFRGDVHPILHGETRLEVTAHWTPTLDEAKRSGIKLGVIDNSTAPEYSIPANIVKLLTESTAARSRATYTARDLSVFLPDEVLGPGQMWTIDPGAAASFLEQFNPHASTSFDRYHQPYGRRPGPAGAFGILRAVSADYLDVLFRVHAEFVLMDGAVLYTPACFLGRLLVDRRAGTVDYFQMRVPTDRPVNVNLTLNFRLPDPPRKRVSNIVFEHVDPMELVGGDGERVASIDWEDALDLEDAHLRLKGAFYKFMDIEWVPPEEMLEIAQRVDKPIVAVVLTSPLDDQSC